MVTLAKSTYTIRTTRNGRVVSTLSGISTPREAGAALLRERRALVVGGRGAVAEIVTVPPVGARSAG